MPATIVEISLDPSDPDTAGLVRLDDGRVFACLVGEVGKFYSPEDGEDARPAFQRAWDHCPDLFNGPLRPRAAPAIEPALPGLAADLTPGDLHRMRQIVLKHWRGYFAEYPTLAQVDNLIDGLGARTAEKLVKRQVDAGRL